MNNMHLEHTIVTGEAAAMALASEMVKRSQYFTFEPLPDDEYEFQFKGENLGMVRAFLKQTASL